MSKIEYLKINHGDKAIVIAPTKKFDRQLLSQNYPKAKIVDAKYHPNADMIVFQNDQEMSYAWHALIEHLLSEGWDLVAVDRGIMHFIKRHLPSA
jgi:hypothetical protein